MLSQGVNGLLVDIVGENIEAALADNLSSQELVKPCFRNLHSLRACRVLKILGVSIGRNDVVTQLTETVLAQSIAAKEWWTNVLREDTHDVVDSLLVPIDLILESGEVSQKTEIQVLVTVGCNLVARSVHALIYC